MPKLRNTLTDDIVDVENTPIFKNGVWECGNVRITDPDGTAFAAVVEAQYPSITPVEFKMCFTSAERRTLKTALNTDDTLKDAYEILEDPRLKWVDMGLKSNRDLIDYMAYLGVITTERAEQIKLGVQL